MDQETIVDNSGEEEPEGGVEELTGFVDRLDQRDRASDRYVSRGRIAHGGMGEILRVWDTDLRRDLAMKVALREGNATETIGATGVGSRVLGRFLEEAQVTGQLDHPGIVPVHEIGVDSEGRVYFTMRLIAGITLEKVFENVHLQHEDWSSTRAVGVVLKVCEAMAYAHSKGVIHRDLKPANIMVGRYGETYVMDWGLARISDREDEKEPSTQALNVERSRGGTLAPSAWATLDGEVIGTPSYMAPEQGLGQRKRVGPLSDVYSVGSVLYHLLAGHSPFCEREGDKEPDAITVWTKLRSGPPKPIHAAAPDQPAELYAICERAMAREPEGRYPSMQALANDLRAYLEGRVVEAYETGALAEFRKWVARNRALAITVLVGLVTIFVGTTGASLILRSKNSELEESNRIRRENEQAAIKNAELATSMAAIADERADRLLRMSDRKRLENLANEADELWPALPLMVERYDGWLHEAREVVGRLPEHRDTLEELRGRALPWTEEERALDAATHPAQAELETVRAEIERANAAGQALSELETLERRLDELEKATRGRRTYTFGELEDEWQYGVQAELVDALTDFAAPDGAMDRIEDRRRFASTIFERSVGSTDASQRWAAASDAVAGSSGFTGLELRPQIGLLPLGTDPDSGLEEFAHLQTGAAPERDSSGRLLLGPEHGLIFVLVPGGTFALGSQRDDSGLPAFDPDAQELAGPVVDVELEPFFVSKYEMTQGQWLRASGSNPSNYAASNDPGPFTPTLLHPVEMVSWDDATELLARIALTLPTEAQWEFAARGGTETPWWTGLERETLWGAANLADSTAAAIGAQWVDIADWPEFEDGYPVHAPVGTFLANPFGLHDTVGNVWEWTADDSGSYLEPHRAGDGLRQRDPEKTLRINRGGSFASSAGRGRSAFRNPRAPASPDHSLGLRPARAVD